MLMAAISRGVVDKVVESDENSQLETTTTFISVVYKSIIKMLETKISFV